METIIFGTLLIERILALTVIISSIMSYSKGGDFWENLSFYSAITLGILAVLSIFVGSVSFLSIVLAILCYRLGRKSNYRRTRRPHTTKRERL
ncbi:MAG: hypothetical protein AAGD28_13160 [Bacteroidota bacterium]